MKLDTDIVETALDSQLLINNGVPSLDQSSGARLMFLGHVRNHNEGQNVSQLRYTAHPQAAQILRKTVQNTAQLFPLHQVYVRHRLGTLQIGDLALMVVLDVAHRQEGFTALQAIVDAIKAEVPIWKEEFYSNGHAAWSGIPTELL